MATRQKKSPFEDLILIISKLPWWGGLSLALIFYLILHAVASRPVMATNIGPGQLGAAAVGGLLTTLAMFGQYLLPLACVIASLVSFVNMKKQQQVYNTTAASPGAAAVNELSWQEFEILVAEHFRREGFLVSRKGGNGPDGGIDLVLKRGNESHLVQCKQWKAYKVGVQPIRELYGVMAAQGAAGGYFVTSGEYTTDAEAFAKGRNIQLIEGKALRAMIAKSGVPAVTQVKTIEPQQCPLCNSPMKRRTAKRGTNAGGEFWGCSNFPSCKGTLPL